MSKASAAGTLSVTLILCLAIFLASALVQFPFPVGVLLLTATLCTLAYVVSTNPRIAVLFAGAGATASGFWASTLAVLTVGWILTSITYALFAREPALTATDKPMSDLKTYLDGRAVQIAKAADGGLGIVTEAKDDRSLTVFVTYATKDKKAPAASKLLRIDFHDALKPPVGVDRVFQRAPRRLTCHLRLIETAAPDAFEVDIPPFAFYELAPGPSVTPHTYALNTPAAVHVFEKALRYSFVYINDESPTVKKSIAYQKNDLDEQLVVRELFDAVEEVIGPVPTGINVARRLNGYIQWCTVWVFATLMLQLAARYAVYCKWDDGLLSAPCKAEFDKLSVFARKEQTEKDKFFKAEREEAKASATFFKCSATPSLLDLYLHANAAFIVSGNYTDVPGFVESRADALANERSARQGLVKYLLWAIPSIGFIGTVVGIGDALLATMNVDAVNPITAAVAKSTVSSNIGVAFDTTLVALLLSMLGMVTFNISAQFEELQIGTNAQRVLDKFVRAGDHSTAEAANKTLTDALVEQWSELKQATETISSLNAVVDALRKSTSAFAGVERTIKADLESADERTSAILNHINNSVGRSRHLFAATLVMNAICLAALATLVAREFLPK